MPDGGAVRLVCPRCYVHLSSNACGCRYQRVAAPNCAAQLPQLPPLPNRHPVLQWLSTLPVMIRRHVLVGRFFLPFHLQNPRQARRKDHLLQRQGASSLDHPASHRLPVSPFPRFSPAANPSRFLCARRCGCFALSRRRPVFSVCFPSSRPVCGRLASISSPFSTPPPSTVRFPRFHSLAAVVFTQELANSSAEVASNCFAILARFFYRCALTGTSVSTFFMQLPRGEEGTTRASTPCPFPPRNSRVWARCGIKPR